MIINDHGFNAAYFRSRRTPRRHTKLLVKHGSNLEARSGDRCLRTRASQLQRARGGGEALIKAGANPNARMISGTTPLFSAANKGYVCGRTWSGRCDVCTSGPTAFDQSPVRTRLTELYFWGVGRGCRIWALAGGARAATAIWVHRLRWWKQWRRCSPSGRSESWTF